MTTRNANAQVEIPHDADRKYFTLAQANSSLPYVRRVVADLTHCYAHVLEIRHDIENPAGNQSPQQLETQYEQAMERLGRYVDELNLVGVELKDFEKGLIDFPSMNDGREVLLCWQLGEDQIVAWHETDEGFRGRQDITLLAE